MLIYGVCISDIKKINEEKAIEFLKELAKTVDEDYLDSIESTVDQDDNMVTFFEWVSECYQFEDGYGLAPFLQEVISRVENVDVVCDDSDGKQYLGLNADTPWNFNERTRSMSEKEYNEILSKYINKITDKNLKIRWWYVNDDCDW